MKQRKNVTVEKEVKKIAFNELSNELRQKFRNKLKVEGLSEEQISRLQLIERTIPKNPQGLNEIIFDLEKNVIDTDEWDEALKPNLYLGKMTDYSAKRKTRQMWGTILHEQAFQYLKEKLVGHGWKLRYGQMIDGKEYDCIGWKGKISNLRDIDLAIEMHFPMPLKGESYEFSHLFEQTRKMRKKLERVDARFKYILLGVPPNKKIKTLEISQSEVKVFYQRYKFGKIKLVKNRILTRFMESEKAGKNIRK